MIYDQCSPELKNKLKGTSRYDASKKNNDVVALLMIIRSTNSIHLMMSTC